MINVQEPHTMGHVIQREFDCKLKFNSPYSIRRPQYLTENFVNGEEWWLELGQYSTTHSNIL